MKQSRFVSKFKMATILRRHNLALPHFQKCQQPVLHCLGYNNQSYHSGLLSSKKSHGSTFVVHMSVHNMFWLRNKKTNFKYVFLHNALPADPMIGKLVVPI